VAATAHRRPDPTAVTSQVYAGQQEARKKPATAAVDKSEEQLVTDAGDAFALFLDRAGERAAEVVWQAALVWIRRAADEALEAAGSRFRSFPAGELRRLRYDLAEAMQLARLAAALASDEADRRYELTHELHEAAAEASRRRRRRGTLEAERVRLLRARCRAEGREPTADELYPWSV
jgi:hypothetical protein